MNKKRRAVKSDFLHLVNQTLLALQESEVVRMCADFYALRINSTVLASLLYCDPHTVRRWSMGATTPRPADINRLQELHKKLMSALEAGEIHDEATTEDIILALRNN